MFKYARYSLYYFSFMFCMHSGRSDTDPLAMLVEQAQSGNPTESEEATQALRDQNHLKLLIRPETSLEVIKSALDIYLRAQGAKCVTNLQLAAYLLSLDMTALRQYIAREIVDNYPGLSTVGPIEKKAMWTFYQSCKVGPSKVKIDQFFSDVKIFRNLCSSVSVSTEKLKVCVLKFYETPCECTDCDYQLLFVKLYLLVKQARMIAHSINELPKSELICFEYLVLLWGMDHVGQFWLRFLLPDNKVLESHQVLAIYNKCHKIASS